MGIYFAGAEYSEIHVAGAEPRKVQAGGSEYHSADSPGTLTVTASRAGGRVRFTFSVADPDGIRSVTSAVLTASDGRTANVRSDFSRSNANTFAGTDSRGHNRWRSGSLTVVYVDNASGGTRTLTQTWSV